MRSPDMTEFFYWGIKPELDKSIQINITAILIQRILAFQANFFTIYDVLDKCRTISYVLYHKK